MTVLLSSEPLRVDDVTGAVAGAGRHELCVFVGLVRASREDVGVARAEYAACHATVHGQIAVIVEACEAGARGARVAVAQRVGSLAVGEAAVVVAASAGNRDDAFAACHACVDLLRRDVPIWRRELAADGGEWVTLRA